ncbi:MAG: hypothetical protein WAL34_25100, partial [Acidobacteriaceae bacterium]
MTARLGLVGAGPSRMHPARPPPEARDIAFVAPMLATAMAGLPLDAAEFAAEVKWHGLRACIAVEGDEIWTWSRNGR